MTVVVIGNAVVDIAYQVERLPGPSQSILARRRTVDGGGKGLNQAIVARRAGAEVRFCAGVGRDPGAAMVRACLEADGLSAAWLVSVPCATDESIVYVARSGENCIVSTDAAAKHLALADVEDVLKGMSPGDVLLVQGNLSREVTGLCLTRACAAAAATILNPAPTDFDYTGLWPMADIVILNQIEAQTLTGEAETVAATAVLCSRGVGNVFLTLGSEGALVREGQRRAERVVAPTVTAVDTTGPATCWPVWSRRDRSRPSPAARRALGGCGGEPQGDSPWHELRLSDQRPAGRARPRDGSTVTIAVGLSLRGKHARPAEAERA